MFSLIWVGSIVATIFIADKKKLNMAGYVILSIILGPIALLIVLLVSPSTNEGLGGQQGGPFSIEEAKNQLAQIRRMVSHLDQRTDTLEEKINRLAASGKIIEETKKPVQLASKRVEPTIVQESSKTSEGFEVIFGKYWLNRIGVILFVIGIGLFISYTFQYLNAFAKVAIGYAISAGFFVWGNLLEKNKKYTNISWGILGGAWGLLYLSTYAMHYIEATRIITNPILEIILLSVVSLIAIYNNLKYKSWTVTAVTYSLAFITASLGGIDYSSVIYFSLLVGSIAYLSYKMNWYPFLMVGIIGSYFTHLFWTNPSTFFNITNVSKGLSLPVYEFQIMFGILAITWMIYSFVFFILKPKNNDEVKYLITGKLLNAGFFTIMGLYEINRVRGNWYIEWDEKFWFLTVLAGIYFGFAFLFKKCRNAKLIVINCAIAFMLAGLAIYTRVPDLSVAFCWIIEMTMLFVLGAYYKESIFRFMAGFLSILVMIRLVFIDFPSNAIYTFGGLVISHNILICSFAALCFYILGAIVNKNKISHDLPEDERNLYFWGFPIFGTILLTILFEQEVASRWLSFSWTLLGSGLLTAGFFLKNRVFRLSALCVLSLTSLRVIFVDMSGVNTIYKIIAFTVLGALLLGISMVYSKFKIKSK